MGGRLKSKKEYDYTVLFEPAAEGGYVVTCPALPGLVTEGDTLAEARKMAKDAIKGYLESLRKDGRRIPKDLRITLEPVKEHIRIALQ
jgi:predicted RNase H-like HicB family nuclease